MAEDTLLVIEGLHLPPWSARGLTQTLKPEGNAAEIHRTVNGDAFVVEAPELRKYVSTISCEDMSTPAFDGVWEGRLLTVHCIARLPAAIPPGWTTFELGRDPVDHPDAVHVTDANGADIPFTLDGRMITLPEARGSVVNVSYRPKLSMYLKPWSGDHGEWSARIGWSVELVEA